MPAVDPVMAVLDRLPLSRSQDTPPDTASPEQVGCRHSGCASLSLP